MPIHPQITQDHPLPAHLMAPIDYKNKKHDIHEAILALEELVKQGATIGEDGEIEMTPAHRAEAEGVFTGIKNVTPYTPPGVLVHLHSMLNEYNHKVVQSADQVRTYVTNKLIEESGNEDARIRMQALISLGKMTDVGLFTERSETKITHGTSEELEDALKGRLKRLIDMDKDSYETVEVIK